MTRRQYFSGGDRVSSLGWSKISKFYQKKIYRLAMTNMTKYAHQINLEIIFRTNMTKTRHLNANMARMNINKTLTKKTAPFAQIMAVQLTRECLGSAHADHSQTEIDQLVSKPKNKNAYTAAPVPDQRRQHATSQHGQRAPGYSNDSSARPASSARYLTTRTEGIWVFQWLQWFWPPLL